MYISNTKSFNIPVSIVLATLAHMINVYEICLNTTNYPIFNMQAFRYCLWTSILDCFGQLVSPPCQRQACMYHLMHSILGNQSINKWLPGCPQASPSPHYAYWVDLYCQAICHQLTCERCHFHAWLSTHPSNHPQLNHLPTRIYIHSHIHVYTPSLTHPSTLNTHSLIHSLTYCHSLHHSLTPSLHHSLNFSITHSLIHSLT